MVAMSSRGGIDTMCAATAEQLHDDMQEWGGVCWALGLNRVTVAAEVPELPSKRRERLLAWLRHHGTADPRRSVRSRPAPVIPPEPVPEGERGRTHLVIGDCHAGPGQDLRRFAWLGRMVRELRPDVVVSVGDWYTFDSLCTHATLLERSGQRVAEELEAGEAALAAYHAALGDYAPDHYITLGNHDDRLQKLADGAPWLDGVFAVGAAHEARGWTAVPFLGSLRIDGIRYQHYLQAAGGIRAISGKYAGLRLLERVRFAESVVVGHSHRLDYRTEASHTGTRVSALVAGCYLDTAEGYASEDNNEWWRGICVLRDVRGGRYDLETYSLERIRDRWGRA
jgi:hypothetical protein